MSSGKVFALVSLKTKAGKGCVLIYKETSSLRKGQALAGKDFFEQNLGTSKYIYHVRKLMRSKGS